MMFSACDGGCKMRPIPHHCVLIFFWSSGIMDGMLFTFENRVPLMRQGASMVWHLSLPLMNSFNKTEAAVFPYRLCFLRVFSFISLIYYGFPWWSFGEETDHAGIATVMPECFKSLKSPGPPTGGRRFITVDPDSMRFFAASLRLWSQLAAVSKLGRTVAVYRNSVNQAFTQTRILVLLLVQCVYYFCIIVRKS